MRIWFYLAVLIVKLEQQLVHLIRSKGYAFNTEKAYVMRYRQYLEFVKQRDGQYVHPRELSGKDVEAFLSFLSNQKDVSPATQRAALSALKFLYEDLLKIELGELKYARSRRQPKLPAVLSFHETEKLLNCFSGVARLKSELMYGCGLRISDCLSLRLKDIDLQLQTLQVNQSKGGKNRILRLPASVLPSLGKQMDFAKKMHQNDQESGGIKVSLPFAQERKSPGLGAALDWYWLFPSGSLSIDPRSGRTLRHHEGGSSYRRKFGLAKKKSRIEKAIVPHTWRHSFATHMLLQGCDLRTLQRLMGHSTLKTTEVYLHVVDAMSRRLLSPLDRLEEFVREEPTGDLNSVQPQNQLLSTE